MSEATIYNWLKQERVDRGEVEGLSTNSGKTSMSCVKLTRCWDVNRSCD
jgi:hypothetical protein